MSLDISVVAKVEATVVDKNITHNLTDMWEEAGIYDALYNSDGEKVYEILPELEAGLRKMVADPAHYEKFNSPNGWGTYKNAVPWLTGLIMEMKDYPFGIIKISK
jgi:hypothetical protein